MGRQAHLVVGTGVAGHLRVPPLAGPGLRCLHQRLAHAAPPEVGVHVPPLDVGYGGAATALGVAAEPQLEEAAQVALGVALGDEHGGGTGAGLQERGDLPIMLLVARLRPEGAAHAQPLGAVGSGEGPDEHGMGDSGLG